MDNLIEIAQSHMENNRIVKAFFYLALEAVGQLTLIAQAQEQIADSLRKFDDNCIVTRPMEH